MSLTKDQLETLIAVLTEKISSLDVLYSIEKYDNERLKAEIETLKAKLEGRGQDDDNERK